MVKRFIFLFFMVAGLAIAIWASDRVTLQGEHTIYTVACEHGNWERQRCTGRLVAGEQHRFRASRSRNEVVFWIAGSPAPSGKYTDCQVTNRDNWKCNASSNEQTSIVRELSSGMPTASGTVSTHPFHAVAKWKWWMLRAGIPGFTVADYGSEPSNANSGK